MSHRLSSHRHIIDSSPSHHPRTSVRDFGHVGVRSVRVLLLKLYFSQDPPAKHTHFNVSSGKTISPRRRKISLFPAPCPLHLPPRTGDGIYPPQSRIATLELKKPSGYSESLPNLSQICYRRPSKERHHGSYVTLQHRFSRIDAPPQFPHENGYRLKKLWVYPTVSTRVLGLVSNAAAPLYN